jgi:hypothetical protein
VTVGVLLLQSTCYSLAHLSEPFLGPRDFGTEGLDQLGHLSLAGPTSVAFLLQDEKGVFNFDHEAVINPETGEQVSTASLEPWSQDGGHRPVLTPESPLPPDSELVPEWRDLGQQVQHHRLQLRRVPGRERGPLPLPQSPSAGVGAVG